MARLLALLFETSTLGPAWSALLCGFAVFGPDGRLYLTDAGETYLRGVR